MAIISAQHQYDCKKRHRDQQWDWSWGTWPTQQLTSGLYLFYGVSKKTSFPKHLVFKKRGFSWRTWPTRQLTSASCFYRGWFESFRSHEMYFSSLLRGTKKTGFQKDKTIFPYKQILFSLQDQRLPSSSGSLEEQVLFLKHSLTVIRLKYQNRHLKTSFKYSILNIDSKPRYICNLNLNWALGNLIWLQLGASGRVKWEVIDGEESCHNRRNALPQYQLVARTVLKANQPSFVLYCCKN